MIFQILLFLFPWCIRRVLLNKIYGFHIEKGAHIGFSIILSHKLEMAQGASIGHLTICKRIDRLIMGKDSNLGNRNYITGFSVTNPIVLKYGHFKHVENRDCALVVGRETGITSRHYFDCNGGIYIGNFCQIAGAETSFMTHSIDLKNNRQDAQPIYIGDYSFIGSRCTFLKGTKIPEKSIVGACSLVNKQYKEPGLYAGVPARFIKPNGDYQFFYRTEGFVK